MVALASKHILGTTFIHLCGISTKLRIVCESYVSLFLSPYVCGGWNVSLCLYIYSPPFNTHLGSVSAMFDALVIGKLTAAAFMQL